MSLWNTYAKLPDEGRKIEFCFVTTYEADIGIYNGEGIQTPDKLIPWEMVHIWKYVEKENEE